MMNDERAEKARKLDLEAHNIQELGDSWFNFVDDIKPEDLGTFVKTYTIDLKDNDEFIVDVHENGVKMTYTVTGMVHYTKFKGKAFNIGVQIKRRTYASKRLLG